MSSAAEIVGFVESVQDKLVGWAFRVGAETPLHLVPVVDGESLNGFCCDVVRPDVVRSRRDVLETCLHGEQLGFEVDMPAIFFDGGVHKLELLDEDGQAVVLGIVGGDRKSHWEFSVPAVRVLGSVVKPRPGQPVHGWLIRIDQRTGEKSGRNRVLVMSGGRLLADIEANVRRPDVAKVMGVEQECGFFYQPPAELVESGGLLHFRAALDESDLRNSPVTLVANASVAIAWSVGQPPSDVVEPSTDEDVIVSAPTDEDDPRILFTRFPREALFGIGSALAELKHQAEGPRAVFERVQERVYETPQETVIATELDGAYYLAVHQDLKAAGVDPVSHYFYTGYTERRRPTPWFDTEYYLSANPDVRAAGINPFWHYLVSGRAEGRSPARLGGYRREIIENLVMPQDKTKGYFRQTSVPQINVSVLDRKIREVAEVAKGFAVSVSHDRYTGSTGGIQLFIADEQAGFAKLGVGYLNISPLYPDLVLAEPSAPDMVHLVLNGVYLGIASLQDLTDVFLELPVVFAASRMFIVHCLLGHHPERLVGLQKALGAVENYIWLHDFSLLCEGFNLLRDDVQFCHAPAPGSLSCRVCIYGSRREHHLQRVRLFFEAVSFVVVAPSRSALRIWREGNARSSVGLPCADSIVHPHCTLEVTSRRTELEDKGERGTCENPVRVAFVGYPGAHKGWPLFQELATRSAALNCYRFYHFTSAEGLLPVRDITRVHARTTPMHRTGMIEALAMHSIDLVIVYAPWPETFSYVTYEAMAAGADVITCGDSGNVADFVLSERRGIVMGEDTALFAFFESLRAVQYVRLCYQQGVTAGELVHSGTTASLFTSHLQAA